MNGSNGTTAGCLGFIISCALGFTVMALITSYVMASDGAASACPASGVSSRSASFEWQKLPIVYTVTCLGGARYRVDADRKRLLTSAKETAQPSTPEGAA